MNHDITLPILYSRTSKGAINTWQIWTEGRTVVCRWGQVDGKMQESRFECEGKNIGRSNETSPEEQAIKEAESKHAAQLRKKYSPTLEAAETSESIKPMLAQEWSKQKHKLKYPNVYGQPKLDGLRCLSYLNERGEPVLHSRGNKFYSLSHIQKDLGTLLKPGMVLDGELYRHGLSLQTINSLVRAPKKESSQLQYHLYDLVSAESFSSRSRKLEEIIDEWAVPGVPTPIVLVETVELHSEEAVIQYQAYCVEREYEGCMVRSGSGSYRYGYRSPDLLKCKTWQTEEFPIVGHKIGKGKFQDVPMIICRLPNGETVDVTPTGSMEQRKTLLDNIDSCIGKPYTVKFFDYSPYGKPLYPTGLGIRPEEDLA